MDASDAGIVQSWIGLQLEDEWPGADSAPHEIRAGDYYFPIRFTHRDFWLVVERRAHEGLTVDELTDFLNEEHWLHRLRSERCLHVQLPGRFPTLVRRRGTLA